MKKEEVIKIFQENFGKYVNKILPDVELTGTIIDSDEKNESKSSKSSIRTMSSIFGFEILPSLIQ